MLTKADTLALLKVLLAAAWADAKLTQSELNYIKLLAQKFKLNDGRIKTLGLGEGDAEAGPGGRVAIMVYPGAPGNRAVQVKNK